MRADAVKVLTEEPRHASCAPSFKTRAKLRGNNGWETEDNMGNRLNSRYTRYANRIEKSFGDHSAPLHRFLEKSVGRRWDDVYSELTEHLDVRTMDTYHFKQHIGFEVEIHAGYSNGSLIGSVGRGIYRNFYVDPYSKLLCKNNNRSWAPEKIEAMQIASFKISDVLEYKLVNGIWYKITYKKHEPEDVFSRTVNFKGTAVVQYWKNCDSLYERISYNQVSGKEIAKIKKVLAVKRLFKDKAPGGWIVAEAKNRYGSPVTVAIDSRVLKLWDAAHAHHTGRHISRSAWTPKRFFPGSSQSSDLCW